MAKQKTQTTQSVRQIDNGFIIRVEKYDGKNWTSSEVYSQKNPLANISKKIK